MNERGYPTSGPPDKATRTRLVNGNSSMMVNDMIKCGIMVLVLTR